MCLIARYLEERGIPTLVVGTALDIVEYGRPPRAVFMDVPLGHGGGPLDDPSKQLAIARSAFVAFASATSPGQIVSLPHVWPHGEAWKDAASDDGADDARQPRDLTPRYQRDEDRQLAAHAATAPAGD